MPFEIAEGTASKVPHPDFIVFGNGGKEPAVRAEGYAFNRVRMPSEDTAGTVQKVPYLDRFVIGSGGKEPAIRAEGYAIDRA